MNFLLEAEAAIAETTAAVTTAPIIYSGVDVPELPDGYRLSTVIRSFVEFFFTPAEIELYSPWINLLTVLGTLFVVAVFIRLLFSPLFSKRSKR